MRNPPKGGGAALITGASSGIGLEFARLFARAGHDLVLVARRREKLEQLAEECRRLYAVRAEVIVADLSDPKAAGDIHAQVSGQGIEIGFLVNNAGFGVSGPFAQTDLEAELAMIEVNIGTLTRLTKLFVRDMLKRGFGRVLNLGSTGSYSPVPLSAVYGATKAYVLSFSEALAEELRGSGVTVTALCPGATRTEFAERAGLTTRRLFRTGVLSAERVAHIGFDAMLRGRRSVIAGALNRATVIGTRFVPRALAAKVAMLLMTEAGN
jgi:short-subunit dehydrogenase